MKAAAKPKLGRPPVPKKLAKGSLVSVRFSESEKRLLETAAEKDGARLSEWARKALISAALANHS